MKFCYSAWPSKDCFTAKILIENLLKNLKNLKNHTKNLSLPENASQVGAIMGIWRSKSACLTKNYEV